MELNKEYIQNVKKDDNGFLRFETVLQNLKIPYTKFTGDLDHKLQEITNEIFH